MKNTVRFLFIVVIASYCAIGALNAGCIPHAAERAENATVATAYEIALEKCVDAAVASKADSGDGEKAGTEYEACASRADAIYGRDGSK